MSNTEGGGKEPSNGQNSGDNSTPVTEAVTSSITTPATTVSNVVTQAAAATSTVATCSATALGSITSTGSSSNGTSSTPPGRTVSLLPENFNIEQFPAPSYENMLKGLVKMHQTQAQAWPQLTSALNAAKEIVDKTVELRKIDLELTKLEADRRNAQGQNGGGSGNGANAHVARSRSTGQRNACDRCNEPGHQANACPLAKYGLWFCFSCKQLGKHKSKDCSQYNPDEHEEHQRRKQQWRRRDQSSGGGGAGMTS